MVQLLKPSFFGEDYRVLLSGGFELNASRFTLRTLVFQELFGDDLLTILQQACKVIHDVDVSGRKVRHSNTLGT